jgi:hypothetical protein
LIYGGTQTFTAAVTGGSGNTNVAWTATGGSFASTNSNPAVYTAPNTAGTYTITAASAEDPTKTGTATVTVTVPPISVSVSPSYVTLQYGASQTFNATVAGGNGNTNVTWTASGGTLAPSGNTAAFTAPNAPGTHTITATSSEDPTKAGTATVTVMIQDITISSYPQALFIGEAFPFGATVRGMDNAVTWEASLGSISAQGVYTAPASMSGNHQMAAITAKSVQFPAIASPPVQVRINSDAVTALGTDNNGPKNPQLLNLANAIGSTSQQDLELYDLNGDGQIDEDDLAMLFKRMGW